MQAFAGRALGAEDRLRVLAVALQRVGGSPRPPDDGRPDDADA
jgi:hypothetical protein